MNSNDSFGLIGSCFFNEDFLQGLIHLAGMLTIYAARTVKMQSTRFLSVRLVVCVIYEYVFLYVLVVLRLTIRHHPAESRSVAFGTEGRGYPDRLALPSAARQIIFLGLSHYVFADS